VLDKVMQGVAHEGLKKIILAIFHLLWKGKPMLEYENMKGLLQVIQMRNYPHKHSWDNISWSMTEITHDIINATIAKVVKRYIHSIMYQGLCWLSLISVIFNFEKSL
jgi:hypothetical protein